MSLSPATRLYLETTIKQLDDNAKAFKYMISSDGTFYIKRETVMIYNAAPTILAELRALLDRPPKLVVSYDTYDSLRSEVNELRTEVSSFAPDEENFYTSRIRLRYAELNAILETLEPSVSSPPSSK